MTIKLCVRLDDDNAPWKTGDGRAVGAPDVVNVGARLDLISPIVIDKMAGGVGPVGDTFVAGNDPDDTKKFEMVGNTKFFDDVTDPASAPEGNRPAMPAPTPA